MITITCTNAAGDSVVFPAGLSGSPFILTDASGVLEAHADSVLSEGALTDGATWHGSRMQKRNIVLTVRDRPNADHAANRAALYSVLRFKQTGALTFTNEEGESRLIGYVVESIATDVKKRSHSYQISLLCPFPYWQSAELSTRTVGGSTSYFQFPHAFPDTSLSAGEVFSELETARSVLIENPGASDEIGLTIELTARYGDVRNPRILHAETRQRLSFGTKVRPLFIRSGETVTITTGRGEKRIVNGAGKSLASYLSEDSEFLMIRRGNNTFSIEADSGVSYLLTTFSWRFLYEGV